MVDQKNFYQPAEWTKHSAVWLAWPSHGNLWQENLESAQDEFTAFCRAIADVDPGTGKPHGERLEVLVPDELSQRTAERALAGLGARFHRIGFGDIWLRDTAPIFLQDQKGAKATVRFTFNGWGGKYSLPHDPEVAENIALRCDLPAFREDFVLEGGAVEVDGEGTCLTSRQCLLNPNRNPHLKQDEIETALKRSLGVSKVLWVNEGLHNDHTDGHIDTIARFIGPAKVVCMTATRSDDPNAAILNAIRRDLAGMTDARGRRLEVVTIPSPGAVRNEDGDLMPASYLNFYIANTTVIVPTYGSSFDGEAVAAIGRLFADRKTVGLPAKSILTGGGAFHCISQQQPL